MKRLNKAVAVFIYAAFGAAAASVHAQNPPAEGGGPPVLAKVLAPSKGGGQRLLVTSNALQSGGELADKFTQNGENVSPPITWTRGPSGTRSYAILVEDAGVKRAEPISHWVVYDIPVSMRSLPLGVPVDAELESGAKQGKNIRDAAGYVGPKPPGQTHPYHFQVFALNTRLNMDPAETDRNDVVNAMKGHVLAQGDLVVNYTGK